MNTERVVLMLDEDTDDHSLLSETLQDLNINVPIRFFRTSSELFEFLPGLNQSALLLVDYNSQPENGLEVLKRVKGDERFRHLPVVVLSDSTLLKYRDECYAEGASVFIRKPDRVEGTERKISLFFRFWFEVAEWGPDR